MKAWCYYESRLLGAHHSLLSTYALETMVLYIFNMYVEELSSPLKVCWSDTQELHMVPHSRAQLSLHLGRLRSNPADGKGIWVLWL